MLCLGMTAGSAFARIELLDGKLVLHGKVQETLIMPTHDNFTPNQLHDYEIHNLRTSIKLEAMLHVGQGEKYQFNIYSIWKNYYDFARDVDAGYRHYVQDFSGHRGFKEFQYYRKFDDICRELYAELLHPLFQIRVGKQVISWGETTFQRMADIINPVDTRGMMNPVMPDFSELKQGLWMFRFYYTNPDMWQQMTFDFLVIPDYQPMVIFPAGHHMMHQSAFNAFAAPNEMFRPNYRDKPKTWGSPELAVKIRGFSWGVDWSLQYIYHRPDSPIYREGKAFEAQMAAVFGTRARDVKRYGWQSTIAATFNKPINKKIPIIPGTTLAMSGIVFSGEFVWEKDRDVNQQVGMDVRVREVDRYAGVLGWDCKIFLPYITPYFRNKYLGVGMQLFTEWVPDRHRADAIYPWVTYRGKGHHFSALQMSWNYMVWHSRIILGGNINYQLTEGNTATAWTIAFKPTFKWTYSIVYSNYLEYGPETDKGDQIVFDVMYEF